ncbi:MAG: HYExAFE family protein [Phycisphaeraceae bacterium]|nr:HYExAFE family protein [Phycisphaeraceae bacterium]
MAQRRFHYDAAFEHYLRSKAIPYVAVDEARRALQSNSKSGLTGLKNFDFVVYSQNGPNLLVDVKGRKHAGSSGRSTQNWVTAEDVDSLQKWEGLFGPDFRGAFVFLFWCEGQPPDALFQEVYAFGDKWYAVQAVLLSDYRQHMRKRSEKWATVALPTAAFDQIAQPLIRLLRPTA